MAKGDISINETHCKGCGYCVHFCSRHCIVLSADRFTPLGERLPLFEARDRCTACGVCAWLCPCLAIEVYEVVPERAAASSKAER